jgi:hypothetical protein
LRDLVEVAANPGRCASTCNGIVDRRHRRAGG